MGIERLALYSSRGTLTIADENTIRSESHAYRVLRVLGQGGQTNARLVEREGEEGSRYVLKLMRIEHVEDWKQVELFERQVTTLAALDHPGIPKLVDRIVEDERIAGIVETYVEGHTLAAQIHEHGPLAPARYEQILRDTLDVLAYLQGRVPPVIHRDINPNNVMLGPTRAHVIDFGAVRVGGKTDMTSVGTFGYMAPEQIIGRVQPASDMYGLGMTMVALGERRDASDLPVDDSTGQVDARGLLRSVEPRVRAVVLDMIKPGLADRLGDPKLALARLDETSMPVVVRAETQKQTRSDPARVRVIGVSVGLAILFGGGMLALTASDEDAKQSSASPAIQYAPPPPPPTPVVPDEVPPVPPWQPSPEVLPAPGPDDVALLTITTTPSGITAHVGDTECTTPCKLRVPFGKHELAFDHRGKRAEREINVLEDTTVHVALEKSDR